MARRKALIAFCPMCERKFKTKITDRAHQSDWTSPFIPRLYCPGCRVKINPYTGKSRFQVKYLD